MFLKQSFTCVCLCVTEQSSPTSVLYVHFARCRIACRMACRMELSACKIHSLLMGGHVCHLKGQSQHYGGSQLLEFLISFSLYLPSALNAMVVVENHWGSLSSAVFCTSGISQRTSVCVLGEFSKTLPKISLNSWRAAGRIRLFQVHFLAVHHGGIPHTFSGKASFNSSISTLVFST